MKIKFLIILVVLITAGLYVKSKNARAKEERIRNSVTYWDINLGDSKDEVLQKKPNPTKESEDVWRYTADFYYNSTYRIKFRNDQVVLVVATGEGVKEPRDLQGITIGKTSEQVIKKFGPPVNIVNQTPGKSTLYAYPEFNAAFNLYADQVQALIMYRGSDGVLREDDIPTAQSATSVQTTTATTPSNP